MAKAPRIRKPAESIRTKAEKAAKANKKPRVLRKTASQAAVPFRKLWGVIKKIARPFRFLLWPFKTRPVRFIGRVLAALLFLRYFRNAWKELRLVTWPGRRETWQLTFAVFIFAVVFGLLVTVTDYGLDKLFKKVLLK